MTYNRYSPEKLDQLVLRLFDIAAVLRDISLSARKMKLDDIPIHDRKAALWCDQLEQWASKSRIALEITALDRETES